MWVVFGLVLVDGSILLMFLLESESTIEERLFSEITHQMSKLKDFTDSLFFSRHSLSDDAATDR